MAVVKHVVIKKYHNLFGPTSFLNALASKPSQKKKFSFLNQIKLVEYEKIVHATYTNYICATI